MCLPWDFGIVCGPQWAEAWLQDLGPTPSVPLGPRPSSSFPQLAAWTQLRIKTDFRALDVPEHLGPTSI